MKASHSGCGSQTSETASGPPTAVQRVLAALLVLGAAEVGQHVVEAPAGIAELAPVIEILGLAAQIEQAVDRARSAQHLAARLDDRRLCSSGSGSDL